MGQVVQSIKLKINLVEESRGSGRSRNYEIRIKKKKIWDTFLLQEKILDHGYVMSVFQHYSAKNVHNHLLRPVFDQKLQIENLYFSLHSILTFYFVIA